MIRGIEFMIKRIILAILLITGVTVICWTAGIFYFGLDFFLTPLMVIWFIIGLSGLLTIPLGIYCLIKRQIIGKWLILSICLSIGFYFGQLLQMPIDNWDIKQRNISGEILTAKIENFKKLTGNYPDSLTQLGIDKLNNLLPKTYQIDKFTYFIREQEYDLEILIPVFDRWNWDKEKREFVYQDF